MDWTQLALFEQPDVTPYTVHLRIGLVGAHMQWQIDVIRPDTGVTVGMVSMHSAPSADFLKQLERINHEVRFALENVIDPF